VGAGERRGAEPDHPEGGSYDLLRDSLEQKKTGIGGRSKP